MKHLSGLWHKLTVVVAVTAALSSCNRAEYAMLPKTTSYHGTANRAVTVAPTTKITAPVTTQVAAPEAVAAPTEAPVTAAPEKTEAVAAVSQAPVVKETNVPTSVAKNKSVKVAKPTLLQRVAISKMAKQVDKVANKTLFNKHREAAKVSRLEGKLRQALILGILGLLLEVLGAAIGGTIGGVFYLIGAILIIIAIVLLVLYLLDEL